MYKIYVAEDDESIREELAALLSANGYEVVYEPPCDLALLDINMPGENGLEICRKLRMKSSLPIIFLTARDSAEDEILGLGMGADDYIRKPYNSSVLLMRISKLLRRGGETALSARELKLSTDNMTVHFRGKKTELTKNETKILACLMKKEVCTKEDIMEELWNESVYVDENALYVQISRLREKLKNCGADGYLRTVRGVGYRL